MLLFYRWENRGGRNSPKASQQAGFLGHSQTQRGSSITEPSAQDPPHFGSAAASLHTWPAKWNSSLQREDSIGDSMQTLPTAQACSKARGLHHRARLRSKSGKGVTVLPVSQVTRLKLRETRRPVHGCSESSRDSRPEAEARSLLPIWPRRAERPGGWRGGQGGPCWVLCAHVLPLRSSQDLAFTPSPHLRPGRRVRCGS